MVTTENMTYEQLCDICQFGSEPVDGKVVVRFVKACYGHTRYRIVSNPVNLPLDQIALFCDSGNLCFGYHTLGGDICVHTD